jgi:hypothetical protein
MSPSEAGYYSFVLHWRLNQQPTTITSFFSSHTSCHYFFIATAISLYLERPFFFVWPPQNKGTWAFWKRTALDQTGLEQKARHSRWAKTDVRHQKKIFPITPPNQMHVLQMNPFPTRQFHNEHSS